MNKKHAAIAAIAGIATAVTSLTGSGVKAADMQPNPFLPAVPFTSNMEPVIPHPKQQEEAAAKLNALEKRLGRKPNILIIVVDDMGWGDPGCYGGGNAVGAPTPNMDRLAEQGLRLTSCYSQPMSTPTRASLMTGRLPARTGLIRPIMAGEKLTRNPWSDEQTAAKILGKAGYTTALSGKWHLGEGKGLEPQDNGYDEFYGFLVVTAEYTPPWDVRRYPELVNHPLLRETYLHKGFDNHIIHAKKGGFKEDVKLLDIEGIANCDQDFLKFSEQFIHKQAEKNQPFYLIHATAKVHFDNWPAEGYQGKSPAGTPYKDAVVEVDDIIGKLIKVLEETGQAENTFV
ncbi:MAG: sulfatase-like hydrolase/transferase, partial [Candidatus Margulisbacteria bacterium]|nr:sulfatase-like hydrolase/transferase [Candidatus Margulisiibacteriota bacterium]